MALGIFFALSKYDTNLEQRTVMGTVWQIKGNRTTCGGIIIRNRMILLSFSIHVPVDYHPAWWGYTVESGPWQYGSSGWRTSWHTGRKMWTFRKKIFKLTISHIINSCKFWAPMKAGNFISRGGHRFLGTG